MNDNQVLEILKAWLKDKRDTLDSTLTPNEAFQRKQGKLAGYDEVITMVAKLEEIQKSPTSK